MKSKVSIIVPVYNVKHYLEACLDSLRRQTLEEIEVICVDDGSTDGSSEILEKYKKKDERFKVIYQKNSGRSVARNVGLKKASSPYVMFCDADDEYDKKMCENMVRALEDNKVDLVMCGMKIIYNAHEEMKESDAYYYRVRFYGRQLVHDKVITETNGSVCNKIFRMELLKKYDINFPEKIGTGEDFYFYSAYMSVSKSMYFLNQKLYCYVRREGSTMSENFNGENLSVDDILIAEKLFHFYKKTGFLKNHKNLFWKQWTANFWTSYRYSGKKWRKEVLRQGKEFINKNYDKFKPQDRRTQKNVEEIRDYNVFYRIKGHIKFMLKRIYLKINIGYRQQDFINVHLNAVYDRFVDLSERINVINKEY